MDLVFKPSRTGEAPIFRQLADHLEALVATDRLPAGAKLPATRELAASLKLGRNTVARAYERLIADGLLSAHVGQGTFVAGRAVSTIASAESNARARAFAWPGLFARRAQAFTVPAALLADLEGARFDFRGGQVDLDSLPREDLAWAFSRAFARAAKVRELAAHNDPYGWPPLREEVARHLASRGIVCTADDIAIVGGAQQAIDLAARVLVDPGDTVVMEQPGYFGAALAFASCEATLVGIGVDDQGLRTSELARLLEARRAKLLYVTPATQSPTGAMMSEERRREVLKLADAWQMPVFEDDYDAELRYAGPPVAALKTQDEAGQIIYSGTFSKTVFPSLRLGYVVAPQPLLAKMVTARWRADFGTGVVAQEALATLLRTRGLSRHLKRIRAVHAARLEVMLSTLAEVMPDGVTWNEPRGGHAVWLTLPLNADTRAIEEAARERGIAYTRGEVFYFDGRGHNSMHLAFTRMKEDDIANGVAELGKIVRANLRVSATKTAGT